MFHGRNLNNEVNNIHKRIVLKDYKPAFNVLLENDSLVNMDVENLQTLYDRNVYYKRKHKSPFHEGDFLREFYLL